MTLTPLEPPAGEEIEYRFCQAEHYRQYCDCSAATNVGFLIKLFGNNAFPQCPINNFRTNDLMIRSFLKELQVHGKEWFAEYAKTDTQFPPPLVEPFRTCSSVISDLTFEGISSYQRSYYRLCTFGYVKQYLQSFTAYMEYVQSPLYIR